MQKRVLGFVFFIALMGGTAHAQLCNVNFTVGPDTMVNCNVPYTIQATPGLTNYFWSNGSTSSSITVTQAGTYWCAASDTLGNVVFNGDFSQGQTGFTSDYIPGTGGTWGVLSNEGQYAVTANSNYVHTNFVNCFDHTVGTTAGNMLVVNGSSVPNQVIWQQTVTVTPGTNYIFSVWGMSAVNSNPGQLVFSINGTQVGGILNLPITTCLWQNFYIIWNSGANTSANIAILNQNSAVSGNDFAIDDISFSPICSYQDTMVLSHPPNPIITTSSNDTICAGQSSVLTANSSIPGTTFTWNPGGLTGSPVTVTPSLVTPYTVTATSPQGCTATAPPITIWVAPVPQVTVTGSPDSICPGAQVNLTATPTFANCTILWQPTGTTGTTLTVNPASSTIYSAVATSNVGCASAPDSFSVYVYPVPVVTVQPQYEICIGDTATLTASSSVSGSNFSWQPGGQTTASIQVFPTSTSTYTVTAEAGGCQSSDATTEVLVHPVPDILVPDDQSICPGESYVATVSSTSANATFLWQPGSLSGPSQVLTPQVETWYYISAEANGCTSEVDSFQIALSGNCSCTVTVPNVFSPNMDSFNDLYHTIASSGCNFTNFDFSIYNRWGWKVFQSNDVTQEWDGKWNGTDCTDGTYFWTLRYSHQSATTQTEKSVSGTLSVFK